MEVAAIAAACVVAVATCVLVVVTWFYAWQTRNMVKEMSAQRNTMQNQVEELSAQRADASRNEAERRRTETLSIRHSVASELRQIVASIEGKRGYARLYMWMPAAAWRASFRYPQAFPDDVRQKLFPIYDEVVESQDVV